MAYVFNSITVAHVAFLSFTRKTSEFIIQMKIQKKNENTGSNYKEMSIVGLVYKCHYAKYHEG